jgi:NhaA family Na+:H+ antiporter
MLGRAVPASLKTFLLALAIIDDLMAIIVIAIFYTDELSVLSLLLAGLGIAGLVALNVLNVRALSLYVVLGVFTWVCVLKSGVHATLAGVAVGLAIPHRSDDGESLLDHAEHALKPWVSYAIVPIFAFANAGVPLVGISPASLIAPVPLGIAAGLFVGKQLGVLALSAAAIGSGLVERPRGATLWQLYGGAILTGIGFTMSLFIGTLAFSDDDTMAQVRLGVLAGSLLSGLAGAAVLIVSSRGTAAPVE